MVLVLLLTEYVINRRIKMLPVIIIAELGPLKSSQEAHCKTPIWK
jgi:hypothetical protein